jgi:hypothetical protein
MIGKPLLLTSTAEGFFVTGRSGVVETKLFHVKDVATDLVAFAVKLEAADPVEEDFLAHAGFGIGDRFLVGILGPRPCWTTYDRNEWRTGETWGGRGTNETMFLVHGELEQRWDELESGSVIDVSRFPHG